METKRQDNIAVSGWTPGRYIVKMSHSGFVLFFIPSYTRCMKLLSAVTFIFLGSNGIALYMGTLGGWLDHRGYCEGPSIRMAVAFPAYNLGCWLTDKVKD